MVKCIIVKYQKFQTVHENTRFLHLNPLLNDKIHIFDAFYGTNISSTKVTFKIKPIHSTVSLSYIVICTPFIRVSISAYVDNSTVKVPILAKIGVRDQGSTSKIWNYPPHTN